MYYDEPVEEFKVGNRTVKIYRDPTPINPREEWDQEDVMVCFHKRYNLGDTGHGYSYDHYGNWSELEAAIREDHNPDALLPIFMIDHSGTSFSTEPFSCPWDSGQVGFVFLPHGKALEIYGKNDAERESKAIEFIKASVKEYDDYCNGNCYGYVVEDEDGEEEDSCWGFLGDLEYCKEQAKDIANCNVKREKDLAMETKGSGI